MHPLDAELESTTRALLAAEDWSPTYAHAPDQHAELIKQISSLELKIMHYLRDLSKDVDSLVNWWYYSAQVQAYNVQVMIREEEIARQDRNFIKIVFDPIADLQATGAAAADVQYQENIDLPSSSDTIQALTTDQVGALVGKKTDSNGLLIDNPRPEFNVDDTTRNRINTAIKKSLNMGLNQEQAKDEVMKIIANPVRAEMIAQTEGVRAYNIGANSYAKAANYQGKYATTAGATDFCQGNADQGVIPFDQAFDSGAMYAPFHIRCRCNTNYTRLLTGTIPQ